MGSLVFMQLLFQQVGKVGLAITTSSLEADVDPVVTVLIVLPDELIEQTEFKKMLYPCATDGDGWEVKVSSFTFHVLGGGDSSYCSVEGGATVTAATVANCQTSLA